VQLNQDTGGDKQNFWRGIMGFESADEIREALLAELSTNLLQPQAQNPFGDLDDLFEEMMGKAIEQSARVARSRSGDRRFS
jgi:hypothetical protein